MPSNSLPTVAISDKINHLLAYFGLAVLLNLTLHFQGKFDLSLNKTAIFTLIIASLYGAADELHQLFVPGRYAEFFDWIANFIGVVLGILVAYFIIYEGRR